jgi:hypothetical protein
VYKLLSKEGLGIEDSAGAIREYEVGASSALASTSGGAQVAAFFVSRCRFVSSECLCRVFIVYGELSRPQ